MQTSLPFDRQLSRVNTPTARVTLGTAVATPDHHIDNQHDVSQAEHVLLSVADYIYAHTSLKPMSKTLFFISRCLLVARMGLDYGSRDQLEKSYLKLCTSLGPNAPNDDFDFRTVVSECDEHIPHILDAVKEVAGLSLKSDSLGLAFNTLLRGKFEGGEGLGTFLTPEEVVEPMVRMLLAVVELESLHEIIAGKNPVFFGDICGGTGRFVYALYRLLSDSGLPRKRAEEAARLFDQSSLAVEFGRLNFLFDGLTPRFEAVGDSLTEPSISRLRNSFSLLATNPPFGTSKYRWTPDLSKALPENLLRRLGLKGAGDLADPSELFLFRNLDLLTVGGALAIVLPDGVIQSKRFVNTLRSYEDLREVCISIAALISLPVCTFSLGGTVAKTSFLILRKISHHDNTAMYVAVAKHVGFVKRGNRRMPDVHGNDLVAIAGEFLSGKATTGVYADSWRSLSRLVPTAICHAGGFSHKREKHSPLSALATPVREFEDITEKSGASHFHISILDADETGLIDIVAASRNRPSTRGLRCKFGDILISCINPKIWRVVCVPDLKGTWTCSPEFLVLRPKRLKHTWNIYLAFHRGSVIRAVQSLAGGTSSSRQRVEKDQILELNVPLRQDSEKTVRRHAKERVAFYAERLREAAAYVALHDRDADFHLKDLD